MKNSMKCKVSKLNKLKIKLLALFVSAIFIIGAAGTGLSKAEVINSAKNIASVNVDKTAKYDEKNDNYNVTLSVNGTEKKGEPVKADIVLCVDTSGSMNKQIGTTRLDKVKGAIQDFCRIIQNKNTKEHPDTVRVGLCEFNYLPKVISERNDFIKVNGSKSKACNYSKGNNNDDSNVICNFTNNMQDITNSLAKLNNRNGYGTNTQAGVWRTHQMLNSIEGRSNSKKYIVFFTDGLTTISDGHGYGNSLVNTWINYPFVIQNVNYVESLGYYLNGEGWSQYRVSEYYDTHFKQAQEEYNKLIGGIKVVGGIVNNSAKKPAEIVKPEYKDAKFYTIAAIDGTDDINMLDRFLSTFNNTGGYKKTNDVDIKSTFRDIADEINDDINHTIAKSPTIEDTIPIEFAMPTREELLKQFKAQLDNKEITNIEVRDRTIVFSLNDISEEGITLKYSLKVSNNYFYGTNVDTNTIAILKYKDPLTNKDEEPKEFPKPKVDITAKTNNIKIEKRIVDDNGNWIAVDSEDSKDSYPILLKGNDKEKKNINSSYNFAVKAQKDKDNFDNTVEMNFILKDSDTDINSAEGYINKFIDGYNADTASDKDKERYEKFNELSNLGWVNIGTYDVSEIVPINYSLNNIEVYYNNSTNPIKETRPNLVQIDENHKDIKIIVTNKKVNNKYWWSKEDIPNSYEPQDSE